MKENMQGKDTESAVSIVSENPRDWGERGKSIDALTLVRVRAIGASIQVGLREVCERLLGISLHGCATLGPVSGADFAVLVLKCESTKRIR